MFVDRFAFLRLLEVKVTDGDLSIYRHANILRLSDAKKKCSDENAVRLAERTTGPKTPSPKMLLKKMIF